MNKAEHEREVFCEFAEVAGIPVAPGSVRSESPPAPDISYLIAGSRRFVELTRAADQGIADDVGGLLVAARRTGTGGVGSPHVYDDHAILRAAVERKAAATHQTDGDPIDLLVYYDGVVHALASLEFVQPTFRALQAEYRERWAVMWLYDRNRKQALK